MATQTCNNCNTPSTADNKLMHCGACKTASYCNKECQKADWKTHKLTCTGGTNKPDRPEDEDDNAIPWPKSNWNQYVAFGLARALAMLGESLAERKSAIERLPGITAKQRKTALMLSEMSLEEMKDAYAQKPKGFGREGPEMTDVQMEAFIKQAAGRDDEKRHGGAEGVVGVSQGHTGESDRFDIAEYLRAENRKDATNKVDADEFNGGWEDSIGIDTSETDTNNTNSTTTTTTTTPFTFESPTTTTPNPFATKSYATTPPHAPKPIPWPATPGEQYIAFNIAALCVMAKEMSAAQRKATITSVVKTQGASTDVLKAAWALSGLSVDHMQDEYRRTPAGRDVVFGKWSERDLRGELEGVLGERKGEGQGGK